MLYHSWVIVWPHWRTFETVLTLSDDDSCKCPPLTATFKWKRSNKRLLFFSPRLAVFAARAVASFLLARQASAVNIGAQMWAGDRKISSVSCCSRLSDHKRQRWMETRHGDTVCPGGNSAVHFLLPAPQISTLCLFVYCCCASCLKWYFLIFGDFFNQRNTVCCT